jgi:NAD(P)-dependent dehydrogenase (short-subunit alcohol dehydrogenase family)
MALVFITGSSTGLGLGAARELTTQGHEVVVHVRAAGRVPEAPAGRAWHGAVTGDLADPAQTLGVADQAAEFGRFDVVLHNAGVLNSPDMVPVNVIAPYILTARMEKPARLIYLSSSMHRGGSTDLTRLTRRTATYSDTKLWVTALAMAVADKWPRTTSHAVDPGWVPTRMGGRGAPDDLVAGHQTQVRLATHPDVTPATGGYWHHQRAQRPHPAALDERFQNALINELGQETGMLLGS